MMVGLVPLPVYVLSMATGLTSHVIFKTYEPKNAKLWAWLLLGMPLATQAIRDWIPEERVWPMHILLAVVFHFTTLVSSISLYRLSPVHPLAQYPGPKLARLSNLWMVWVTWNGKRHLLILDLHRRYGTHVRIGPNLLSVASIEAFKQCLGSQGLPRSHGTRALEPDHLPPHLLSSLACSVPNPVKTHSQKRAAWGKGFNPQALEDYDIGISARSAQLVDRLGEVAKDEDVDLSKWFSYFTFDFMGDLVFGGGFTMLRDGGDKEGYWKIVKNTFKAVACFIFMPWLNNHLERLPLPGADGPPRLHRFAAECIRSRKARSLDSKDLLYYIAEEDSGKITSEEALINDAFLAVSAGADTTSGTLSNLFHLLLANRDVLDKLRAEIEAHFGPHEDPTNVHVLANLPYLNACINETLRFIPTVPFQISRAPFLGSGGVNVAGRFVPEGTAIYFPPIVLARNPKFFWPSPEKFWPERWLSPNPDVPDFIHNREAFIPFSYGPANCVGKHLAYRQMRHVTVRILQQFDIQLQEGHELPQDLLEVSKDYGVFPGVPLPVRLLPRT